MNIKLICEQQFMNIINHKKFQQVAAKHMCELELFKIYNWKCKQINSKLK